VTLLRVLDADLERPPSGAAQHGRRQGLPLGQGQRGGVDGGIALGHDVVARPHHPVGHRQGPKVGDGDARRGGGGDDDPLPIRDDDAVGDGAPGHPSDRARGVRWAQRHGDDGVTRQGGVQDGGRSRRVEAGQDAGGDDRLDQGDGRQGRADPLGDEGGVEQRGPGPAGRLGDGHVDDAQVADPGPEAGVPTERLGGADDLGGARPVEEAGDGPL